MRMLLGITTATQKLLPSRLRETPSGKPGRESVRISLVPACIQQQQQIELPWCYGSPSLHAGSTGQVDPHLPMTVRCTIISSPLHGCTRCHWRAMQHTKHGMHVQYTALTYRTRGQQRPAWRFSNRDQNVTLAGMPDRAWCRQRPPNASAYVTLGPVSHCLCTRQAPVSTTAAKSPSADSATPFAYSRPPATSFVVWVLGLYFSNRPVGAPCSNGRMLYTWPSG